MAKKTFWVGMLVLLLVFGMAVTGCDNGTTGGGGGNGDTLRITGVTSGVVYFVATSDGPTSFSMSLVESATSTILTVDLGQLRDINWVQVGQLRYIHFGVFDDSNAPSYITKTSHRLEGTITLAFPDDFEEF